MKKALLISAICLMILQINSYTQKTELFDLVKLLMYDSTGFSNVGDWAVGKTKKFPVKWKDDAITMSEDTAINFYRMGTVDLLLNGNYITEAGQPLKWNIMLKGPRMGYGSFAIISSPSTSLKPKMTVDSLFGNKIFMAELIKSCDRDFAGYYYYKLKVPGKDVFFIKLSWVSVNGKTAHRIDGYDEYFNYAAKLDCAK